PLKFQGRQTGDYPFFKVSDMNNDGNSLFMSNANHWIDEDTRNALGATIIPSGSIVFAKIGAAIFLERKRILSQPSCIDNNMMAFIPNSPNLSQRFFHYTFLRTELGKLVSATALPSLSSRDIGAICYEFPRDDEQRAIAEALSDADALIASLDALIAKKRDLKQAAMQQLLTGKTRLPGFEGEWEDKSLGEIGEISGAGVDKKVREGEQPVRLLNYMDVYRRTFIRSSDLHHAVTAPQNQARRCAVEKGDVFFTPSSETRNDIANSAVAIEDIPDGTYSYHVVRLRIKEDWDLRFRAYAFQTKDFLDQAEIICDGSGTRYVISLGNFRKLTVRAPKLGEQTAIASVLADMDAELAALEAKRDKARSIKQGMMQELLTGRIRLV
ncbi:MAG: restriction endonuclease subunit S, partial [Xanthobacteraceae bacterium]|nr:restriction endonuclease subunit S [Xanthobacteraceae bacterium]